jgi:hypothetical protein
MSAGWVSALESRVFCDLFIDPVPVDVSGSFSSSTHTELVGSNLFLLIVA